MTVHTVSQEPSSNKHSAKITRGGIQLPSHRYLVPFEILQDIIAGLQLPLLKGAGLSNPMSHLMNVRWMLQSLCGISNGIK